MIDSQKDPQETAWMSDDEYRQALRNFAGLEEESMAGSQETGNEETTLT